MNVQRILERKGRLVATVRPDATIGEAAELLRKHGVGALVVSREVGGVDGILSERDIVRALPAHGAKVADLRVATLMSRDVVTCAEADSIADVMMLMTERRVRHIPVVEKGRLAGIVSIGDVVKSRIEEIEDDAHAMRELIASA